MQVLSPAEISRITSLLGGRELVAQRTQHLEAALQLCDLAVLARELVVRARLDRLGADVG